MKLFGHLFCHNDLNIGKLCYSSFFENDHFLEGLVMFK